MQIIVLGPHRSGTSAVTRLINMMGAYFAAEGKSLGANPANPKGFWERKDVYTINEGLLKFNRCLWESLANWDFEHPVALKKDQIDFISNLLLDMDAHRPWVLKDPRMCLTFAPYWRQFMEVPVVVVVTRDPREVALSLQQRNRFHAAHGLGIWEYCAVGILRGIEGLPVVRVAHQDVIADPVRATRELYAGLLRAEVQGLRLPSAREITAFIEPKLYRAKDTTAIALSDYQQQLWDALRGTAPAPAQPNASPEARQAMPAFTS